MHLELFVIIVYLYSTFPFYNKRPKAVNSIKLLFYVQHFTLNAPTTVQTTCI